MTDVVLCELEGVVAETKALRRRALERSFADEGLTLPPAALADADGLPAEEAVRAALRAAELARDDTDVALLALRAERHFAELAGTGIALAPGAREFLDRARETARLALVTRAHRRDVDLVLGLAGLEALFECIVAAEDTASPKPSPAAYRTALDRLARRRPLRRERVLALEDGLAGIRAARAAGVRCIAVGTLPAHVAAEADAAVASIAGHTPSTLDAMLMLREEITG
ncbi:MAG: HAD family phosphatase [Gemmatimonadaceae bacterium]|nr:HAD family phosphatase [Gemmatimonadaceae bacterium]